MAAKLSGRENQELRYLRARAARSQRFLCHWCHLPMQTDVPETHPRLLTGDHLIPLYRGGKTIAGNIVAACRECNNLRHPELTSMGGGIVATAGDDSLRSPFEMLAKP